MATVPSARPSRKHPLVASGLGAMRKFGELFIETAQGCHPREAVQQFCRTYIPTGDTEPRAVVAALLLAPTLQRLRLRHHLNQLRSKAPGILKKPKLRGKLP